MFGFCNVVGDLSCVFVFFARDGTEFGLRAAIGFGRAGLTDQFQPAIFCSARTCWATAGIGVVAAELLEQLTFWADVLVALWVPLEVFSAPGPIGTAGLINDGDMRCELNRAGFVGGSNT